MVAFQNPVIQTITIPSGATTGTRIVIDGVNGTINVYDANNVLVGQWRSSDAVMMFQNDSMTGKMEFHPSGLPGYGSYPGIYFFAANTPGGYAGAAYIQANPDANNSPQIGINSGQYIDTSGLHGARGRIFLADHVISINNIDVTTNAEIGGSFEAFDNSVIMRYTDPTNSANSIGIFATGIANFNTTVPILNDTWKNVTFSNSWSNNAGFSACQCRMDTSGYVHLRGSALPGTRTDGTTILTLPAGYAPPATKIVGAAVTASTNPSILTRLEINTDGTVQVFGAASPVISIMLDGITFESNAYTA
jgi:hypothetical protein